MCTFLGIFTLEKAVFWCLTGQNGGLLDLVDLCDGAEDVGPGQPTHTFLFLLRSLGPVSFSSFLW